MNARAARGPSVVTPLVAAAAALAHLLPGAFAALSYQRGAILSGQAWRLLSGHLVHRSVQHLAWNLAAFLILGFLAEGKLGRRFGAFLLGSALAVSAGLLLFLPGLSWYCGLSGVDSALFGYLLMAAFRAAIEDRDWLLLGLNGLCGAGLLGKTAFEFATGGAVFSHTPGLRSVPAAHLFGALVGMFVMIGWWSSSSRPTPSKAA